MTAFRFILVACAFAFAAPAQAAAQKHHRHHHRRVHIAATPHGSLVREPLPDGQVITVARDFADRFTGFFAALFRLHERLPPVHCYAPTGHMRHSLHHWGGACDVGQKSRNKADPMMYHVRDLARQFGLTDGCTWRHPDCGHVDVSGLIRYHEDRRGYAVDHADRGSVAVRRHTRTSGARVVVRRSTENREWGTLQPGSDDGGFAHVALRHHRAGLSVVGRVCRRADQRSRAVCPRP
jgi:hypothetical protein